MWFPYYGRSRLDPELVTGGSDLGAFVADGFSAIHGCAGSDALVETFPAQDLAEAPGEAGQRLDVSDGDPVAGGDPVHSGGDLGLLAPVEQHHQHTIDQCEPPRVTGLLEHGDRMVEGPECVFRSPWRPSTIAAYIRTLDSPSLL